MLGCERLQHEDATPRQQRAGELEARVFGRRADQRDDAVLDPWQKRVLLRAIEAVDLVAKQNRALALEFPPLIGLADDLADARHPLGDRGERLEMSLRVIGDDARQGRLAGSRRAPENAAAHVAATDQLAQRLPRSQELLLAEKLVQRTRTHPRRQWLRRALEQRRLGHGNVATSRRVR